MGEGKIIIYNSTCQEEFIIIGFSKKEYKSWLSDNTIDTTEKRRSVKIQLDQVKTRLQKEWLMRDYISIRNELKKKTTTE